MLSYHVDDRGNESDVRSRALTPSEEDNLHRWQTQSGMRIGMASTADPVAAEAEPASASLPAQSEEAAAQAGTQKEAQTAEQTADADMASEQS